MEQGNDIPSVIEEVFKRYTDGSYIKASMLPDLDLYVDQITTFLTRHLAKTIRFEDAVSYGPEGYVKPALYGLDSKEGRNFR